MSYLRNALNVNVSKAMRCPYCVEGGAFRLMQVRADGEWFLCTACGHLTMHNHPSYRCNCKHCTHLETLKMKR